MEYSPPPLFKQGAPARVKMTLFACISIALLLVDARMNTLPAVRKVVGTALYPLQMAALLPRDAINGAGDYFSTVSSLEKQVRDLKRQQIQAAQSLQQAALQTQENAQLRRLMEAREHIPVKSMLAEVLYDARDVNSRKIILDRGTQQGMQLGLPVIDNQGVVGQVTRVFPFTSEVTLLTDKDQAIPVQLLRNGLRSVAYGRGKAGNMELRFTAPNADIQVNDIVVTSGLDGIYPAGLAVARVSQVENSAGGSFGGVICQPLAGIQNNTQLLVLMSTADIPPRPPEDEFKPLKKVGRMGPVKDAPKDGAAHEGAPAGEPAAAPAATPNVGVMRGTTPPPPPAPAPAPAAATAGGQAAAAQPQAGAPAAAAPQAGAAGQAPAPAAAAQRAGTPAAVPAAPAATKPKEPAR
jgi:rod shape-determining protein MreC